MNGDQTLAGVRRYLVEVLGEFAGTEFDRMLAEARREGAVEALTEAAGYEYIGPQIAVWLRDRAAALRGDDQ